MIKIQVPDYCVEEIDYVIDTVFSYFWGIEHKTEKKAEDSFRIILDNGTINTPSIFFKKYKTHGIAVSTLPVLPLAKLNLSSIGLFGHSAHQEIPVVYGSEKGPDEYFFHKNNIINLDIDIFGSVFFMLTRFEEYSGGMRDIHDRFSVFDSVAYKAGFLDRPLVNEYLELLWKMINHLSPGLRKKQRVFSMEPSHDVDVPFFARGRRGSKIVREALSEIIIRRRLNILPGLIKGYINTKSSGHEYDPYFTFRYIMDQSEKRNLRSTFYFIADNSAGEIDGTYNIEDQEIRDLVEEIITRGHNIGLHGSYNSYLDKNRLVAERRKLEKITAGSGMEDVDCIRQHYLRFSVPETFLGQEYANFKNDSTLGYAEKPGFRCGVCYDYPVFDLHQKRKLNIIEKPLIAMECSMILPRYAGLVNTKKVTEELIKYKDVCKKFNGSFTLLWHNSHLAYDTERSWYETILDA